MTQNREEKDRVGQTQKRMPERGFRERLYEPMKEIISFIG